MDNRSALGLIANLTMQANARDLLGEAVRVSQCQWESFPTGDAAPAGFDQFLSPYGEGLCEWHVRTADGRLYKVTIPAEAVQVEAE